MNLEDIAWFCHQVGRDEYAARVREAQEANKKLVADSASLVLRLAGLQLDIARLGPPGESTGGVTAADLVSPVLGVKTETR